MYKKKHNPLNKKNMSEYEVLQVQAQPQVMQIDALERANVDTQVATAKKYPRDMRRSLDDSIVMATLDKETAQSCGYALPRGNKPITGPSVHLAKIIVSNWGEYAHRGKGGSDYRHASGKPWHSLGLGEKRGKCF